MVLLYAEVYTVTNVHVASSLLKQIIILHRIDNPASTMHIREMLIESKRKLLLLKGNIMEFNQWVTSRWADCMQGSRSLLTSSTIDKIPSTNPGAEPPRDARDSGSARSHSTHLETSSSDRP